MTGEFGFTCFKVDQTNFVPVFRHQTQLQMSTKIPSNLSVEMQFTRVTMPFFIMTAWDCWLLPPQNTITLVMYYLYFSRLLG